MRIDMRIGRWALFACTLFVFGLLSGCGGGAGSVSGSGLNVFFSDDFSDDYDQVWVRVHQVDVVGSNGTTTVFQSDEGEVIDLASLNDGAPRFAYMGSGNVTNPQSVRVVLDNQLSLVPTGSSDAVTAEFTAGSSDPPNRTVIELAFSPAEAVDSLVIDFDLSQWSFNGGFVDPVVRSGSQIGLHNDDRQEERSIPGVVRNLGGEAPFQNFVLRTASGHSVRVSTFEETIIYGPDGGEAELANGQHVLVTGKFSTSVDGFMASEIQIRGPEHDQHRILGEAFSANFDSCTFLVELKDVRGFIPNHRIITVLTPEGTKFLSPSGEEMSKARFYEALSSNNKKIVAEGLYDSGTNSFTARVVKLHHEHDGRHEVETVGEIVHINIEHRAFALDWREWHGGPEPDSDVVKVFTGENTRFFSPDGTPLRAEVFFNEVEPGAVVEVHGLYGEGVIRAFHVNVRSWGGGNDQHVAFGEVVSLHPDLWKFRLAVHERHGFGTDHEVISVFVHEDTQIVDHEGNEFSREQFFGEMEPGGKVTVYGIFDGESMSARKIVVHRWGDDHRPVRAVGTAVEWNFGEGRFWISLIEWSGFDAEEGDEMKVQTNENTVFKNPAGVTISKEHFFAELSTESTVLVEGHLSGSGESIGALFCKLLE